MRIELNAPPGYRWTDDEVRYEKRNSWHDGWVAGWVAGMVVSGLILAVTVMAVS